MRSTGLPIRSPGGYCPLHHAADGSEHRVRLLALLAVQRLVELGLAALRVIEGGEIVDAGQRVRMLRPERRGTADVMIRAAICQMTTARNISPPGNSINE
jgi:hypothetical protein